MPTKSDFMAAEEIKLILQDREKVEQERIIRWVVESLGLSSATIVQLPAAAPQVAAPSTPPSSHQPAIASPPRSKDIKTFVGEKKPKSDMQFAAVVGYFFRYEAPQNDRKETIQAKDLQEAGRQARGVGFDKPLVTLNNAVAQGYFDRAARGEFKLNAVGENLVAMTLPNAGGNKNSNKTGGSNR